MKESFAATMRDRQLIWALNGHVPHEALEVRRGRPSWVLKPEHKGLNLFNPGWWRHIAGSEHKWARSLNSSQCFAVNLFSPLAADSGLAKSVLNDLLPNRGIQKDDVIKVHFEYTPAGAPGWLGESGQPTQVDVCFEVTNADKSVGFILIEVKFTEAEFGSCRGWNGKKEGRWTNPDRNRCLDVHSILRSAESQCWLTQSENRRYWELLNLRSSSISPARLEPASPCPFRYGLYQMMRNRLLADELQRRHPGTWAEFVVCRHPENEQLVRLPEPTLSSTDAFTAFRGLSSQESVLDWHADNILERIMSFSDHLGTWSAWMTERYFWS